MQSGWNYEETLMVPMIEPVYEQIHKSKTLPMVEHMCKEPFDHFKENPKIIFHPNSVEFPNLIQVSNLNIHLINFSDQNNYICYN